MDFNSFKKKFHITLSSQQEEAVLRESGETLVLAVPGSGKTTTIVTRAGYLIHCLGVDPLSILTITYSKAAAIEMRDRFLSIFGNLPRMPRFSTIHSLCVSIIQYANRKTKLHIPKLEPETTKIIRRSLYAATSQWPSDLLVDKLALLLTKTANQMLTASEITEIRCPELKAFNRSMDFAAFLNLYEKYKKDNDLMDFDDQLKLGLDALENEPDILNHFHILYRHIGVDEAQDTSWLQYSIIRILANGSSSLFMVGDDDQSIYSFRGAEPRNLFSFTDDYPFAKVLYMETNYRSGTEIVQAADRFITENHIRYEKKAIPSRQEPGKIEVVHFPNETTMYEQLMKTIAQFHRGKKKLAVIARNNYMFLPLVARLDKKHIPVRRRDNFDTFFNTPIIQGVTAFLRLAIHSYDAAAFRTVNSQAKLYIKKEQLDTIQSLAESRSSDPESFDVIECAKSVCSMDEYVIKRLDKLRESLRTIRYKIPARAVWNAGNELMERTWYDAANTSSIVNPSTYLEMLTFIAEDFSDLEGFLSAMEVYMKNNEDLRGVESSITLTTVHSSKGLEFDEVILIEAFAGIMPAEKIDEMTDIEAEEEARLFYVAATRAKDRLQMFIPDLFLRNTIQESPYIGKFTGKVKPPASPTPPSVPAAKEAASEADAADFSIGDAVLHKTFGRGVILGIDRNILSVDFETAGQKRILAAFCIKAGQEESADLE